MKQLGNQFYYDNQVYIPKDNIYNGVFNNHKDEYPELFKTSCYVTFEPSGMIKAGRDYGVETYGQPVDYF